MNEGETKTVSMDMTIGTITTGEYVSVGVNAVKPTTATSNLILGVNKITFSSAGTESLVVNITAPSGSASTSSHAVTVTATSSTGTPAAVVRTFQVTVQSALSKIIVEPGEIRFDAIEGGERQTGSLKIYLDDHTAFTPTVRKFTTPIKQWLNCKDVSSGFNDQDCNTQAVRRTP